MAAARRARSFLAMAAIAGLAVGYFGGRFNPPPKEASSPVPAASQRFDEPPPPPIIPPEQRAATGVQPTAVSLASVDSTDQAQPADAEMSSPSSADDECARAKASPESADADVLRRCGAVVEMEPFVVEAREQARAPKPHRRAQPRSSADDERTLNAASPYTQEEMPGRVISFAAGSDTLPSLGSRVLSDIARRLKDDPTMIVRVIGRSAESADPQSNLELGLRRADAAAERLIQLGVPAQQIERVSSGDAPTGNEPEHPDASGVEVVIMPARPSFL